MKIQPVGPERAMIHPKPPPAAAAAKSRLKRLFERRQSSAEKLADLEPSSAALDGMVESFMEGNSTSEKMPPTRCCTCFSFDDISDDGGDDVDSSSTYDSSDLLKSLICCSSVAERNLLADASNIVEKVRMLSKEECRRIVAARLRSAGYDAAICRSRWEKSPSCPAGDHEYVDVAVVGGGERMVVEIDFRSEFEIARSTKGYRALLQSLPPVFVGTEDRVGRVVAVVSEAARQSLRKKGLHFPPWRKPEYVRAKWLGPYERRANDGKSIPAVARPADDGKMITWQPPAVKSKESRGPSGPKVVMAGLASVLQEKN